MAKRKLWKLDIDIRETNWCINLVIMDNVVNQPNLELTFAHPTKQWTELSLPRVLSFTEYIVMCRICLLFCIFLEQRTHITKLRSFVVFGCSVSYLQCTLVRMVNWIDVEISSRYTYSTHIIYPIHSAPEQWPIEKKNFYPQNQSQRASVTIVHWYLIILKCCTGNFLR